MGRKFFCLEVEGIEQEVYSNGKGPLEPSLEWNCAMSCDAQLVRKLFAASLLQAGNGSGRIRLGSVARVACTWNMWANPNCTLMLIKLRISTWGQTRSLRMRGS